MAFSVMTDSPSVLWVAGEASPSACVQSTSQSLCKVSHLLHCVSPNGGSTELCMARQVRAQGESLALLIASQTIPPEHADC